MIVLLRLVPGDEILVVEFTKIARGTMVLRLKRYYIPILFKVAIIVPLCVFLFVAACGYFFGGSRNLLSTIVSWFVIIPLLNVFLSKTISGHKNLAFKSLMSLLVFYGIMVFMIYKHYQTDFFKIMIASLIFNSLVMLFGIGATWFGRTTAK